MALSASTLAGELRKIFDPGAGGFGWPASRSAAIASITAAYDTYASDAVDYSGDAVASKSPSGFQAALAAAFSDTWTAADAADAFRDAWIAYWTGATFAVGAPPPPSGQCPNSGGNTVFSVEISSAVTIINGAPLRASLLYEFGNLGIDGDAKATAIAAAFHAATTNDITCRIDGLDSTPPPTGPLPIFNLCRVF